MFACMYVCLNIRRYALVPHTRPWSHSTEDYICMFVFVYACLVCTFLLSDYLDTYECITCAGMHWYLILDLGLIAQKIMLVYLPALLVCMSLFPDYLNTKECVFVCLLMHVCMLVCTYVCMYARM